MPSPLIDIQGLTKTFGALTLFKNISFSIAEGQRVGLIARNGAGKSTLLSIITGNEACDSGNIVRRRDLRIACLEQSPVFDKEQTVLDACFNRQATDEHVLRAKQVLTRLRISDLNQPMGQLSGGQQKRVALARVLITQPDLLILDEPTNHLDIEMTEWLEDWLVRGNKTLLIVTHDRYFLDRVCTSIIELDGESLYTYRGNYAYFVQHRKERIDSEQAATAKVKNLYRRELEWMRRQPQARGHKARYREEAFYELQSAARHRIEERQLRLAQRHVYIGSKIFECQYVSKAYGEDVLLRDFYYCFARFEKLGIVGGNGAGKSTFIRMLLGDVKPDAGRFDIGDTVRFGYFSQEGLRFDERQRVIDVITAIADYIDIGGGRHITASQMLQRFLFTPEQQYTYVSKLSGGERRKLYLCTVLMANPNFLVLDEPTNDLDIPTLQALEEYLIDFAGCVIVVSHDRFFLDRIVDHILFFHGNGEIRDFPGNYTQYREWSRLQSHEAAANDEKKHTTAASVASPKTGYHNDNRRRLSYREQREMQQLENEISALESEQTSIEERLCSGTLTAEEITTLCRRLPQLKEELDEKSMRWLELSEIAG